MSKINKIILNILIVFFIFSCSKKEIKKSLIEEKSLELQVYEAYSEGKKSLENSVFVQSCIFLKKTVILKEIFF